MLNFQEMITELSRFWAEKGCVIHQGYDLEVGAGTFNPATFLRCLGPEPYAAVYVEPSRRPQDGRYGDNPNRVQFYHQMQVIIKPSPIHIQDYYLQSLERIGLDIQKHDIRFVHDDWENPTIGAWGLGWEVWAEGMEISQFTYFQAVGGIPCKPVSSELTYGLERLAMYIQGVDSIFDLKWNQDLTYGDIYKRSEWEWSHYNFSHADVKMWMRHFEDFEAEAKSLIRQDLPIPAYDFVMKASHAFNILDARGAISVTERTGYMGRIRSLAKSLAESYLQSREKQEFPLLKPVEEEKIASLPELSDRLDTESEKDFLLEIGSEELPATFVPIGLASLEHLIKDFLSQNDLAYASLKTYGTPRRLALSIQGLATKTEDKTVERKGPAVHSAFNADGLPTKAGTGFLHSIGLSDIRLDDVKHSKIAELEIRPIKGVDYLFATIAEKGRSTYRLLAHELPQIITKIDFPKKMRWANFEIEYARPLRWIAALFGEEIVPFAVGPLTSGRLSYGHRLLTPESFTLHKADAYLDTLKSNHVMVDIEERKNSILEQLERIETEYHGKAIAQSHVLPQVLHLVEWPFLTVGNFDTHFLQAPKEVLISEMVEHQKYFPMEKDGALLPHFIIVSNNHPSELIRKGNQKALSPRLADGMFLFEEDLKVPLSRFNEKLKNITFQKQLGSVWSKVERLKSYCKILHSLLPICELEDLQRAAELCKADLASDLVGEFPELQGVMGKIYALKQGEAIQVAQAIDEHWMPRGEKAPLPTSACGKLLCLADKIDNFLSCFSLGLKPTSSSDPYALRRQGFGLLKILLDLESHLPLNQILKEMMTCFLENPELAVDEAVSIDSRKTEIIAEIEEFLAARMRTILADYDFKKDEIEAILAQGIQDCYEISLKLKALHTFRMQHPQLFEDVLQVHTRTKKILYSQNPHLMPAWQIHRTDIPDTIEHRFPQVQANLFQHESEQLLYRQIQALKQARDKDYSTRLRALAELKDPVEKLFTDVKIIDDNPNVRLNRLSLLQEIWDPCEEIADFSCIQ